MAEAPLEQLKPRLWPQGDDEHTYALLDGARDPRVFPFATESSLPSMCLYAGQLAPALARVAPYLVRLPRNAPASLALLEAAWGRAWGVFLRAPAPMVTVHGHFRRLLRVQDERGARMLFRFYDPRVLRVYLPTCWPGELTRMFGPVESFVMESPEGNVLQMRQGRGVLVRDEARVEKHLPWLGEYLRKSRDEAGGG
jgi:hypothetical protein